MIWLLVGAIVVMIVVLLFISSRPSQEDREVPYEVIVDLYAIHRRVELALLKTELRRRATRARRELDDELDGLDRGKR